MACYMIAASLCSACGPSMQCPPRHLLCISSKTLSTANRCCFVIISKGPWYVACGFILKSRVGAPLTVCSVVQAAPGSPPASRDSHARAAPASGHAFLGLPPRSPARPRQPSTASAAAAGLSPDKNHTQQQPSAPGSQPAAAVRAASGAATIPGSHMPAEPSAYGSPPLSAAGGDLGQSSGAGAACPRARLSPCGLPRLRPASGSANSAPTSSSAPSAARAAEPAGMPTQAGGSVAAHSATHGLAPLLAAVRAAAAAPAGVLFESLEPLPLLPRQGHQGMSLSGPAALLRLPGRPPSALASIGAPRATAGRAAAEGSPERGAASGTTAGAAGGRSRAASTPRAEAGPAARIGSPARPAGQRPAPRESPGAGTAGSSLREAGVTAQHADPVPTASCWFVPAPAAAGQLLAVDVERWHGRIAVPAGMADGDFGAIGFLTDSGRRGRLFDAGMCPQSCAVRCVLRTQDRRISHANAPVHLSAVSPLCFCTSPGCGCAASVGLQVAWPDCAGANSSCARRPPRLARAYRPHRKPTPGSDRRAAAER